MPRRLELSLITLVLLAGAFLRLYRLSDLPPGWRDDEVVETVVHAQSVLDGRFPLFFPQAEGHEPLYHYLSAALITLAGRSLFTVRLLSVFFGMFSLAALYRFARRYFGPSTALLATAALAVSFWGLMYSRFKLRHVSEVGLMLLTFYFFLRPLAVFKRSTLNPRPSAILAGVCLSLSLYTYFAARTVPLILLAFAAYLALFHWPILRIHWRNFALAFIVAGVLTAPLARAIATMPGGETRLNVVGQPLQELLQGNFGYALRNTAETLGMFAFTGDPEFLYNLPHRPVFEWFGAALFLVGLLISLWRWRQPKYTFLLLWLVCGLAPAFVSTPSASLGHTIAAQPVVYLFPATALTALIHHKDTKTPRNLRAFVSLAPFRESWLMPLSVSLFLGLTATRDLRDYFTRWPALPEVRYLYRAELHEAAQALRALPSQPEPLALASRDLHQADVAALRLETADMSLAPRLFNPARAWLFPNQIGTALLRQSAPTNGEFGQPILDVPFALVPTLYTRGYFPQVELSAVFTNGWVCQGYTLLRYPDPNAVRLYTYWRVGPTFTPPPPRDLGLLSGSPLALKIFSHVLNPDGTLLAGDDRLDVDPATLRPGDDFVQLLGIPLPPDLPDGVYPIEIGLYDPVGGARVPLSDGADHLTLTLLSP